MTLIYVLSRFVKVFIYFVMSPTISNLRPLLSEQVFRSCISNLRGFSCSSASSLHKNTPGKASTTTSKLGESSTSDLDFNDVSNAFKSKTNFELIRGALVYQLCTIKPLVKHGDKVSASVYLTVLEENLFVFC